MNKKMRILIYNPCLIQRLSIEKMLNSLGYYRIVSISTFAEIEKLLRVDACPIDILIINKGPAEISSDYEPYNPGEWAWLDHAFYYSKRTLSKTAAEKILTTMVLRDYMFTGLPDKYSLQLFMQHIDPPT